MKCQTYSTLKMLQRLILFCLFLLLFVGCCSSKKVKVVTTTIYKVDTIIMITPDTVIRYKESRITDTIRLENKTSIAKTYINPLSGKLILQLQEKPFEVKVNFNKIVTEKKKEVTRKGLSFLEKSLGLGLLFLIILLIFKR